MTGSCDHQQWLDEPFASDCIFLAEDPNPTFEVAGLITASRTFDHQPLRFELRCPVKPDTDMYGPCQVPKRGFPKFDGSRAGISPA
jgi:hypothetical protein